MSSKKKRRSPNFSPEEQSVFFSLVARYVHIIENKKTDAPAILEKEEVWREIASKFNAQRLVCFRSQATLHKYYLNRKAAIRKALKQQDEISSAGKVRLSETDAVLFNILNDKTTTGNSSDSDDIYFAEDFKSQDIGDVLPDICIVDHSYDSQKPQVVNGDAENIIEIIQKREPKFSKQHAKSKPLSQDEPKTNNDWSSVRPVILSESSADVGKKNEQLLAMKLEATNLQIAIMKSELSCKQSEQLFKHEEQRLKIEILKTELEIKKQMLKRAHIDDDDDDEV